MIRNPRPFLLSRALAALLFCAPIGGLLAANPTPAAPAKAKAPSEELVIPADCKPRLANEKILLLFAERITHGMNARQELYDLHLAEIERRAQSHGVTVLAREENKKKNAQPGIDAHFKVDPSKAQRLVQKQGATMTLRGLITSRRAFSMERKTTETYLSVNLDLVDANGYYVASAIINAESPLGADTLGTALGLIKQHGDDAVLKLFTGYCGAQKLEKK